MARKEIEFAKILDGLLLLEADHRQRRPADTPSEYRSSPAHLREEPHFIKLQSGNLK